MPVSNSKRTLTGGRALYKGANAYASQGFENDSRQTQLGGLLIAYLVPDFPLVSSTDNILPFPNTEINKLFSAVYLRGFTRIGDTGVFVAQKAGTYRVSFGATVAGLFPTQTSFVNLYIRRNPDIVEYRARQTNPDAANNSNATLGGVVYADLLPGDSIYLTANPGVSPGALATGMNAPSASGLGGTLYSFDLTYLHLEQIDLPSPA